MHSFNSCYFFFPLCMFVCVGVFCEGKYNLSSVMYSECFSVRLGH